MKTGKGKVTLCGSGYSYIPEDGKICARGLEIRGIDNVVNQAKETKVLDLSKNQLSSLDNIYQFTQLREIDVSDNQINSGSELLKLKKLTKLHKIFLRNNPLLEQPLSEDLLNFLTFKSTDIGLLEPQNQQAIKSPCKSSKASANQYQPNTAKTIHSFPINKPESQLKSSLEPSMTMNRRMQQGRINSLIENLRGLIGGQGIAEQQESLQESIQQAQLGQRNRKWHFSPENQNQSRHYSARFMAHARESPPSSKNYHLLQHEEIDARRSKLLAEKPKHKREVHEEQAVNYFSFSVKKDMPAISTPRTSTQKPKNISGSAKIHTNCLKDIGQHSEAIKDLSSRVIPTAQHKQASIKVKQSNPKGSCWLLEANQINMQSLDESLSQCLTHEQYQILYYHNLNKYDPTFNLLYSDFKSLQPQEKDILISALEKDHRQKTIDYLKEKEKNKIMRGYLESLSVRQREEKQKTIQAIRVIEQYNAVSQRSFANQKEENSRLTELIGILSSDLQVLRQENQLLQQGLSQRDDELSSLRQSIINQREVQHRQKVEQQRQREDQRRSKEEQQKQKAQQQRQREQQETGIQQLLIQKHRQRIKKEQFHLLLRKARQHHQINRLRQKQKPKQVRLMQLGWTLLKRYSFTSVLVRMKWEEKLDITRRVCFKAWLQQILKQKQIKQSLRVLWMQIKSQSLQKFLQISRDVYKRRQQRKLSNYWANRHYTEIVFFRFKKNTEAAQKSHSLQNQQADTHRRFILKRKLLKMLSGFQTQRFQACQLLSSKVSRISISQFYLQLRRHRDSSIVRHMQQQRVQQLFNIIMTRNRLKAKKQAVRNILSRMSTEIEGTYKIQIMRKLKSFSVLRKKTEKGKHMKEKTIKASQLKKIQVWGRMRHRFDRVCRQRAQFQDQIFRAMKCKRTQDLVVIFRQMQVEKWLQASRKQLFYGSFVRKFHEAKLYTREVEHCRELQQAEEIIQKMKSLEELELAAITDSYTKEIEILNNQISCLQQQLQMDCANRQDLFCQKEQELKLLQNQLRAQTERDIVNRQQQQLMLQEISLKNDEIQDNHLKIGRLKQQVAGLNLKYDKTLEMYSVMEVSREKQLGAKLSGHALLSDYAQKYDIPDKAKPNNQHQYENKNRHNEYNYRHGDNNYRYGEYQNRREDQDQDRREKTLQKKIPYENSNRDFKILKTSYH